MLRLIMRPWQLDVRNQLSEKDENKNETWELSSAAWKINYAVFYMGQYQSLVLIEKAKVEVLWNMGGRHSIYLLIY